MCMITASSQVTPSPSSAAQRRAQRRVTRVDNRYHSGQLILYIYYAKLRLRSQNLENLEFYQYNVPCTILTKFTGFMCVLRLHNSAIFVALAR